MIVRDIHGADEMRACQELQRKAWGITEDGYVVPVATMASAQRVGGLILGAFDSSQMLVGFAFAFLGKLNGRLVLWSQLTGVHPAHQRTGVGRALKLEQRRRAAEMELEAVAWAFDPLQASNAAFNLGVLGATARTYEVDMYGTRSDALNAGIATDRLLVEWSTRAEPARMTSASPGSFKLISVAEDPDNPFYRVTAVHAIGAAGARQLQLEIPANLASLKMRAPMRAAEWRTAVRLAFQAAFAEGFIAVGFSRADPAHPQYLLERP